MSQAASQSEIIQALRQRLMTAQHSPISGPVISSGFTQLDKLLPDGGLRPGTVVEFVGTVPGSSAAVVALQCVRSFLKQPGALTVIDGDHQFNSAAAAAAGIPLHRLLLIRPPGLRQRSSQDRRGDLLWSLEQSSRCAGVRVVLCWLDRVSSTVLRRLQLAVEASGVTVFLIRPASSLRLTSWADLRLQLAPAMVRMEYQLQIQVVHSRHAVEHHGVVSLRVDHETNTVSEIPQLAPAASADQRTG